MKIYLDNAASTQLDRDVYNTMMPYLLDQYGIPSAAHGYGRDAKTAIEINRAVVAKLLNALPEEIVFTGGGSAANSLAIHSAVSNAYVDHVITTRFEHPSVLDTLKFLRNKHDIRISYIKHDEKGNLDHHHLEYLVRTNPQNLVSVMHGNYQIGNLNDITAIAAVCEKYKALFHTDAAQTLGHYRYDLREVRVNFLAASAHKLHGPQGVGLLYCRKGTRLIPSNLSGGENIAGIIGLAKALTIAGQGMESNEKHLLTLKERLVYRLSLLVPGVRFNGNSPLAEKSISPILSVTFPPSRGGRGILQYLIDHQIAVSGADGSGFPNFKVPVSDSGSEIVRFSFSKFNTLQEIDHVAEVIASVYQTAAA